MTNLTENLEELKQEKRELDAKIHLTATMVERKKLEDLQEEVALGRARVEELNARAYEVSISNQAEIKTHLDAVEMLKLQSFDITADAWELQNRLHGKQVEMIKLREAIEKAKSL
jgi:hypothetical protein